MKDFQFWLYIIIGAIYLLSRLKKKAQPNKDYAPQAPDKPARTFDLPSVKPLSTSSTQRPQTFEELLQEITQGKTQPSAPSPYVVDYDDAIEEEAKDLENVNYDYRRDDKVVQAYEDAKKQAFYRQSLEETMKVGDTDVTFGKFKEFELKKQRNLASEYLTEFRDLDGLRKAIVMSEILQRKF